MDERQKKEYREKYQQEKEKGVFFFPDLLFKDALVALVLFLILVGLAFILGAPLEERANPADTNYTPRPEWYFLFLFQMLKYFPGSLEVVGVIVIPTIAILVLVVLPFLDRGPKRHFSNRKLWVGITLFLMVGISSLTIVAYIEAPPPTEAFQGDAIASLYSTNCAGCHGPTISLSEATNLHALIAEGGHEGMPAWSGDLTTDEIDGLVGFILSPQGSRLFVNNCGGCHQVSDLVASDPFQLRSAIEEGAQFAGHAEIEVVDFSSTLTAEERTSLLNFLVAPDGQRLYALNCAACHGRSVGFAGSESDLRSLISQGGLHLEMPPWQQTLTEDQIDLLAGYVVDPASMPEAATVFQQYCVACHGERIPTAETVEIGKETIATGGAHETMPVWGDILTSEQLDALTTFTISAAQGSPTALGQELYIQNCAGCHGDFGEGGANPARPGDIIAPISTAEYLETRDNLTLQAIIAQGQPNFGMAPFGNAFGGPLDDEEVNALVSFIRAWEEDPPVELPPEVAGASEALPAAEIYGSLCAQCHGETGEGGLGPSFQNPVFQSGNSDQEIFNSINLGHPATPMIAWGEILTSSQIRDLVAHLRNFRDGGGGAKGEGISFVRDVVPILEAQCTICHGNLGGWDATSYDAVMNTGNNAPVVLPGDPEGSFLGQKLLGTHTLGAIMPPAGKLPGPMIQVILDWIAAGALDN